VSDEVKELKSIKKLLIMLLKVNKVKDEEIARVLGVDRSTITHVLNPKSEKGAKEA